jgi:hypothetical protein
MRERERDSGREGEREREGGRGWRESETDCERKGGDRGKGGERMRGGERGRQRRERVRLV